jgi:ABC-type multidrug transport system fused ATPase/permease subunit
MGKSDISHFKNQTRLYCLLFVAIAAVALIFFTLTPYVLSYVAFALTSRMRESVFLKIMRMPIVWFEN